MAAYYPSPEGIIDDDPDLEGLNHVSFTDSDAKRSDVEGVPQVGLEAEADSTTPSLQGANTGRDHSQQTENIAIQPPDGFAEVFSTAQQEDIRDSMDQNGPHRAQWGKIMRSKPPKDYFPITLGIGRSFTEREMEYLGYLTTTAPPHQMRAYSLGGTGRSGGFTGPSVLLSNSCRNHIKLYRTLENMTAQDASVMLDAHLCWIGRKEDEFLSWTSSFLLVLGIAFRRHETGQKHVYIAGGNTRKFRTTDGAQAAFYPVLALMRLLPLVDIFGLTRRTLVILRSNHFTQESVSFGDMLDPEGALVHVLLEDLVENGLLELIPELVTNTSFLERNGMYNHCLWLKQELFWRAEPQEITDADLILCNKLSACFKSKTETKAPFWCFIKFLAVRLRPSDNPAFKQWVRKHYNENDIMEGVFNEMEHVADNLPDVKQAMLLAREAAESLELVPNPIPYVSHVKGKCMDVYAKAEIRRWPTQFRPFLDLVSIELVKKRMYGPDEACLAARRELAKCDDDLAALLKLVRLANKADSPMGFDSPTNVAAALSSDGSARDPADTELLGSTSLADEIARLKEEEKKREAARAKKAALSKAATNKQSRDELHKILGLPSPSEMRRKKQQEAKKAWAKRKKYALYGQSVKKHAAEHDPEMPPEKRKRRVKSIKELRADCLLELERLSGRLYRREISRNTIRERHGKWKKAGMAVMGKTC